ncbi:MAG: aminoacetone oxidase family FAD-binding enzyme [Clostridia bacterium]|nr:aminoacetone oxidase family FAD-binding enzyme [Clostridia bacterium]
MKLAIIGGGASGMAAAIEAARTNSDIEIIILERLDRVGKKILATGNGRCNYSNINACVNNYYGRDRNFVSYALEEFDVNNTVNFFNQLGVFPKEEKNGKLYPFSEQASAVSDALRNELARLNVEIISGFQVVDIKRNKKFFKLEAKDGRVILTERAIAAGGGCASPALGSDGSCFRLLEKMGHKISDTVPALVQFKTDPKEVKSLQGIKFTGNVSLIHRDKIIGEEYGEVLFTDYGISGPPVFQLSAKAAFKKNLKAALDFMPEYSPKQVYDILESRKESLGHLTMENYFVGLLNKRIGNLIARRSGIEKLSYKVCDLTSSVMWSMASHIKEYVLEITGTKGFQNAQVTAGGAITEEFNYKTMESRIVKGLYACGEVLDIYGDCGGYNLQWAWSSGRLAGRSAAVKE